MSRCSIAMAAFLGAILTAGANAAPASVWKFDNLDRIGGLKPKIEGQPRLVDGPLGKAVQFNGKDTALFFSDRPLVGAKTFTIEAIFRPEGGAFEQRWMHIAETDPATGADTSQTATGGKDINPRYMFEIRVKDNNWYLDGFVQSKAGSQALIDPTKLHPVGPWYAVAQTYDGKMYRTYVNGDLQAEAPVGYTPHGPGHVMIGVRMNHVNYFKGAVAELRFTDHVRKPGDMLTVPVSASGK